MAEPDDNFIARWSRRKRGAEPDAPEGEPTLAETGDSPQADPARSDLGDQLPDIDSLDENADFTVFLKEGVPEELRKLALRKLWRLNPVFANLDGLNDYDEDFTLAASALETVKTLYQVGEGMPGPAEPAEPPAGEQEAGGAVAAAAPAGKEAVSAGDEEALDECDTSGGQQMADADPTPVAQQSEGASPPTDDGTPDDRRDRGARTSSSGRSAAERRWGRLQS